MTIEGFWGIWALMVNACFSLCKFIFVLCAGQSWRGGSVWREVWQILALATLASAGEEELRRTAALCRVWRIHISVSSPFFMQYKQEGDGRIQSSPWYQQKSKDSTWELGKAPWAAEASWAVFSLLKYSLRNSQQNVFSKGQKGFQVEIHLSSPNSFDPHITQFKHIFKLNLILIKKKKCHGRVFWLGFLQAGEMRGNSALWVYLLLPFVPHFSRCRIVFLRAERARGFGWVSSSCERFHLVRENNLVPCYWE